jgi:GDPmannose 4,6-dehydratase
LLQWEGKGVEEKGIDSQSGAALVLVDPRYFRPTEVDILIGNSSKAERLLGWKPRVQLHQLVEMMVDEDLIHAKKELHLKRGGFAVKDFNE